jgi:hypothetical protein
VAPDAMNSRRRLDAVSMINGGDKDKRWQVPFLLGSNNAHG